MKTGMDQSGQAILAGPVFSEKTNQSLRSMKMKRIITLIAAVVLFTAGQADALNYGAEYYRAHRQSILSGNVYSDPLYLALNELEGQGATNQGTGDVFYVDSGVASAGDGKSWLRAKATLDEAIALCTANNGDVIYVAQGHAEDWTTTDSVDVDVAGVTIIGCGTGIDRPTFTYDDTDPELVVGEENVYIYNLAFLPSVTAVVHAIEIEADANNCTIDSCWFMNGETSGTDEFIDAIQPAALANDITVKNCVFETYGAAGANTGIDLTAGVHKNWLIAGNYFSGDYAEAPIYNDNDVDLRMRVLGNVTYNTNSGNFGIEFGGAATGVLAGNIVYTDAVATAIDPGSMACFDNLIINTTDLSAMQFPPLPAIGTVTAGSADDILKKMYYTADGTGAYPATVANDSTFAKIMTKGATATASTFDNTTDSLEAIADAVGALGVAGVGAYADEVVTHFDANSTSAAIIADLAGISELGDKIVADMDANSVLADLAGMTEVGDYVVASVDANSTIASEVTAVKAVTDDLAGISQIGDKVQADMDANSVLYWQPRATQVGADEVTQDLWAVSGGPIEILSIWGYVDAVIGGNATSAKLWVDTTAGASYDQDFSTSVAITDDAVGTMYIFSAANPAVLTPLTPGSEGAGNPMYPWICPAGVIEQLMTADPGGAVGDHITWTMVWRPLAAGITVTAQ